MREFIKLSPLVQGLIILCGSGIVTVALINQTAGAALVALVAGLVAVVKRGDKSE